MRIVSEIYLPLSCVKVLTGAVAGPAPALLNALTLTEYLQTNFDYNKPL